MTESEFWQLVETSTPLATSEEIAQQLKTRLLPLSEEQLAEFDKYFSIMMRKSYTWDLWGAAYVIAGCNSEYAFAEFRSWLISRGKLIFDSALNSPDSLAKFNVIANSDGHPYPFLDEYDLIAGLLYEEKTGQELPFIPSGQEQPRGKQFNDKTKVLKTRYPALFKDYWIANQPAQG